jgi:hypothetical protein
MPQPAARPRRQAGEGGIDEDLLRKPAILAASGRGVAVRD